MPNGGGRDVSNALLNSHIELRYYIKCLCGLGTLHLLPSPPMRVGAIRRFLGAASSFSDSLVSRLPSMLPLTELAALAPPAMGVCGGVVHGKAPNELVAATLGTLPKVGVGLLVITPPEPCACDDCVAIEDAELDRVGLGG